MVQFKNMNMWCIALGATIMASTVSPIMAATLRVPAQHATIQSAINAAIGGDLILVNDGIYSGEGNINLDFTGRQITLRSTGGADRCIINCNNAGRAFQFTTLETIQTRVEGFTLTGGQVNFPGGGAVLCDSASPMFVNCAFTNNSAGAGGAVYCDNGSAPTFINCVWTGNTASLGGGLFNQNAQPTLINCTLAENSGSGGGMYNLKSNIALTNCIVWGNSPDQVLDGSGATSTINYSNIGGGWTGAGTNNINADPLFVDVGKGNVLLKFGSPCIDASNTTLLCAPFDLTGKPRAVDDPDTPDTGLAIYAITVDMGVHEYQPTPSTNTPTCAGDTTGDGLVNVEDLLQVLSGWGPCP